MKNTRRILWLLCATAFALLAGAAPSDAASTRNYLPFEARVFDADILDGRTATGRHKHVLKAFAAFGAGGGTGGQEHRGAVRARCDQRGREGQNECGGQGGGGQGTEEGVGKVGRVGWGGADVRSRREWGAACEAASAKHLCKRGGAGSVILKRCGSDSSPTAKRMVPASAVV